RGCRCRLRYRCRHRHCGGRHDCRRSCHWHSCRCSCHWWCYIDRLSWCCRADHCLCLRHRGNLPAIIPATAESLKQIDCCCQTFVLRLNISVFCSQHCAAGIEQNLEVNRASIILL